MAKIKFIKKAPMKNIGSTLIKGGLRYGATVGAAYLDNSIIKGKDDTKTATIRKITGPAMLAIGLAGDIFLEEPHALAVAQGIGCYGALSTAGLIAGTKKAAFGLAGENGFSGTENSSSNSIEAEIGELDWSAMADELIKSKAGTRGVDDDEDLNGNDEEEESTSGLGEAEPEIAEAMV